MAVPPVKMGWLDRIVNVHWSSDVLILRIQRGNYTLRNFDLVTTIRRGPGSGPPINWEDPSQVFLTDEFDTAKGSPAPSLAHPIPAWGAPTAVWVPLAKFYTWWRTPCQVVTAGPLFQERWDFGVSLKLYPAGSTFVLTHVDAEGGNEDMKTFNYQLIKNGEVVLDQNDATDTTATFTWTGETITLSVP